MFAGMKSFALVAALMAGTALAGGLFDGMTKITTVRLPMDPQVAIMCANPMGIVGPHMSPEVDILVNDVVLAYRRQHPGEFAYPVGSKFVKEKYATEGAAQPELATVMVKRDNKGTVDDWEFSTVALPGGRMVANESGVSCASCHARFAERGYISAASEKELRDYLNANSPGAK